MELPCRAISTGTISNPDYPKTTQGESFTVHTGDDPLNSPVLIAAGIDASKWSQIKHTATFK